MRRPILICSLIAAGCGEAGTGKLDPRLPEPSAPPVCTYETGLGEVRYTTAEVDGVRSVLADRRHVYVHQRDLLEGQWQPLHIQRIDAITGERRVYGGEADAMLLDARGGGMLIAERGDEERMHLSWRAFDAAVQLLPEMAFGQPISHEVANPVVRSIEPGFAGWYDRGTDRVRAFLSGGTRDLSEGLRGNGWPDGEGGRYAWATAGEAGRDIALWSGGERVLFRGTHPQNLHPVVREDDVVFASAEEIFVRKGDGRIENLHSGACGPPVSSGGKVAFACDPFVDHPGFPGFGRELFVYDGEELRRLPAPDGMITSVRIAANRVAWISYQIDQAGCGMVSSGAAGRILVLELGDPDAVPIQVGSVSAPCWCCDAAWAPGEVALSEEVVAWNYAMPGGEPGARSAQIGYALLSRTSHCATP